jgi:hypothetical protein
VRALWMDGDEMKYCRECGQPVADESEKDRLHRNLFVWTVTSLFFWGIVFTLPPQWTIAWWRERSHVMAPLIVMPAVSIYFWVQFFRNRQKK